MHRVFRNATEETEEMMASLAIAEKVSLAAEVSSSFLGTGW